MQSFIKAVKPSNSRETQIKKSITTQLSVTLKDIQLCSVEEFQDSQEAKNSLCSVVEAMFLHGLRDSIAHRFKRALSDVDRPPEPNFWSPLLVISHRQIIDQITGLSQIVTEIGQCRAWIRLTINEALLSSYLTTIIQDSSALKSYYHTYAYMRDVELLEVAQKLIVGVESINVMLPSNSSLLNSWPVPTLLLAGIWSPTLRTCPIAAGVDIAQSLQSTSSVNSETCSLASIVSQSSGIGQIVSMNHDEALKMILAKTDKTLEPIMVPTATTPTDSDEEARLPPLSMSPANTDDINHQQASYGNSINRQSGWSFDDNVPEATQNTPTVNENQVMENSFNSVIESSYNLFSGSHILTPDFRIHNSVWHKLEPSVEEVQSEIPDNTAQELLIQGDQPLALTEQISTIAQQKGLDNQDYMCGSCKEGFTLTHLPRVCEFTGEYFCDSCMAQEVIPIPARIIHNWDFKGYHVSQKTFNCLQEVKDHPLVDFKLANPFIYTVVEEMAKLQVLRNQLNYLRAYLYTCREPVIEELQQQMYPRQYMYEHIHQYSISDLLQIQDGKLSAQLEKVVEFGTDHVLNCWLCKQKGFLCEMCKNSKALFPFDTDNVYRCNVCSGVYHKTCLNALKPCPRCKRKKDREDLPLLEVTLD